MSCAATCPITRSGARSSEEALDFNLTAEQEAFQSAVRRFAERHLSQGALARAHADEYPWEVAKLAYAGQSSAETDAARDIPRS